MNIEVKDKLLEFREDLITLVGDLQRVISKQEDLVRTGQFTLEDAKRNIEKFENNIKYNLDMIQVVEKQLKKATVPVD